MNRESEPWPGPEPRPFSLSPWYLCPSVIWRFIKTLALPLSTNLHEDMATWLWIWVLHHHLAKPSRFHFLNCSPETKLGQPPLVILVTLPLNCLHFVSLFLAVTWNQAAFSPLFRKNAPAGKGSSLSQGQRLLFRICELHVAQFPGVSQTDC